MSEVMNDSDWRAFRAMYGSEADAAKAAKVLGIIPPASVRGVSVAAPVATVKPAADNPFLPSLARNPFKVPRSVPQPYETLPFDPSSLTSAVPVGPNGQLPPHWDEAPPPQGTVVQQDPSGSLLQPEPGYSVGETLARRLTGKSAGGMRPDATTPGDTGVEAGFGYRPPPTLESVLPQPPVQGAVPDFTTYPASPSVTVVATPPLPPTKSVATAPGSNPAPADTSNGLAMPTTPNTSGVTITKKGSEPFTPDAKRSAGLGATPFTMPETRANDMRAPQAAVHRPEGDGGNLIAAVFPNGAPQQAGLQEGMTPSIAALLRALGLSGRVT